MRRFWVLPENVSEFEVLFDGDSYNHLIKVSRMKVGDQAEVVFGEAKALTVELIEVSKKEARGKVVSSRALPVPQKPYLELAFCMPKPAVFEAVLEKSVELGVHSIQPLFNANSFFKKAADFKSAKWDRWEKIIQAATEQSGRGDLMKIFEPKNLLDYAREINQDSTGMGLFFYEGESAFPAKSYLESQPLNQLTKITAFIGSEGGFSPQEVKELEKLDFKSITIGPQILRAETACVAIMSVIKYQLGQMQ